MARVRPSGRKTEGEERASEGRERGQGLGGPLTHQGHGGGRAVPAETSGPSSVATGGRCYRKEMVKLQKTPCLHLSFFLCELLKPAGFRDLN